MLKKTLPFILLALPFACVAQETSVRYFKDQSLRKEVTQERATYARIETKHEDGSLTTSVKNVRKDEVIRSQTYKGAEPVGIWVIQYGSGPRPIDYSFQLRYSDEECGGDSAPAVSDYFVDDASIGYKAPSISTGENTFNLFLAKNIVYPAGALREGIQGTVHVSFTITKEGNIEDVYVQQGTNILLDKEAVRVVRKLRVAGPATLHGETRDFCVTVPVSFRMI